MSLSDYAEDIAELKSRAKISGIVLFSAILFFLVFPADLTQNIFGFYKPVVSILLDHIRTFLLPQNVQLLPGSPSAPLTIYTTAGLFFGFLVASPVIFYESYAFVRPALEYSNIRVPRFLLFYSLSLFVSGSAFGFFIMCPAVLYGLFAFFPYVGATQYLINAQDFYSMIFWTTLVCGATFETPLIIYLAAKYLNFDPKSVTKNRWYLWAGVYIGSAIVTPDSNILADFVLFIPLIVMIEVSLFFSSRNASFAQSSKDRQC